MQQSLQDSIEIDSGKMSIQAETIVFALSIASRLERDLISERTKTALRVRKAKGIKLGRPEGYSVLNGREDEVEKWLEKGLNKSSIATVMDVSRTTIYSYLRKKDGKKPGNKPVKFSMENAIKEANDKQDKAYNHVTAGSRGFKN